MSSRSDFFGFLTRFAFFLFFFSFLSDSSLALPITPIALPNYPIGLSNFLSFDLPPFSCCGEWSAVASSCTVL